MVEHFLHTEGVTGSNPVLSICEARRAFNAWRAFLFARLDKEQGEENTIALAGEIIGNKKNMLK